MSTRLRLPSLLAATLALASAAVAEIEFDREVRPLLATYCFECHGPDANTREGDLRLDVEEEARRVLEPGEGGAASLLAARVHHADRDERMPPPGSAKRPTHAELKILDRWLAAGAPWAEHWAFVKPERPPVPTAGEGWARNPIDRFVAARHASERLKPSPEAGRETLIRRASLTLTGLPPTPEEVDAFLADGSEDAFEKVVERLLASPRYGEHVALEWLDAARYADSAGYQADWERHMWPWRDWVVDAYNRNMPFDQFTVEQLAGDMLPDPTQGQLIATGFNRNHRINDEGGSLDAEFEVEYVVDRVDTTSMVWLGLSAGCARCHDHKFDPISQREFYQLFAFFNNVPEKGIDGRKGAANPYIEVPNERVVTQIAALRERARPLLASRQRLLELPDMKRKADLAREIEGLGKHQEILKAEADGLAGERLEERRAAIEAGRAALADLANERAVERVAIDTSATEAQVAELAKEIGPLEKQIKALEPKAKTMVQVMREQPGRRPTYLLERGDYRKPDTSEVLTPMLPALFGGAAAGNRLELARWLVGGDNPLTARVIINRLWQQHFGTGLVATSEDFGTRGERPSHPELLDWLATEFVGTGWDLKAMQKLVVTSATFRQSSHVSDGLFALDPANRLLARGPRLRLTGEAIRDSALLAGGLLVERLGGPPVKPYQPEGLWGEVSFGTGKTSIDFYQQDHGEDLYRRSLYTFWKRTVAPPMQAAFDRGNRDFCTVRRGRTNTPMQALALQNDPTFVEAARHLAGRMMREGGEDDRAKIHHGWRLVTARVPEAEEVEVLERALGSHRSTYRDDADSAVALLSVGESQRDAELPAAEHAAWTMVALTLLNLDEAITRE